MQKTAEDQRENSRSSAVFGCHKGAEIEMSGRQQAPVITFP